MNRKSIRITPDDFVVPPEFARWQPARPLAGQIGGVRIELCANGGLTRLGACYQQIPLRALPPFHFANDPCALFYLLNPTAGLLDGDSHFVGITARAGTNTVVTGQSANRVHPSVQGFATQQWAVHVEAGARLVVLPGPTIPFRGSRYFQRVRIDLDAGAELIWGDIWLPGRYAQGPLSEWYCFDQIVQEMEVRRQGDLVYRERFHWQGPWDERRAAWFCGAGQAAASLFVTGEVGETFASRSANNEAAILRLAGGDSLIRFGGDPRVLAGRLVDAALILAASRDGKQGKWLSTSNFAPNHWWVGVGS